MPKLRVEIPAGYWLMRWLEIHCVIFPEWNCDIKKLDSRLVSDAFCFFCARGKIANAAVIAKLAGDFGIEMNLSVRADMISFMYEMAKRIA